MIDGTRNKLETKKPLEHFVAMIDRDSNIQYRYPIPSLLSFILYQYRIKETKTIAHLVDKTSANSEVNLPNVEDILTSMQDRIRIEIEHPWDVTWPIRWYQQKSVCKLFVLSN